MNGKRNDVIVWNAGSLTLVRPVTQRAEEWVKEHVQGDAQWYGDTLVVEPRYVEQLVNGMKADGLEVV